MSARANREWYTVDRRGLANIVKRRGKSRTIFELIQNAWDAPATSEVHVTLTAGKARGMSSLVVTDDSPEGFADLADAFTLFAPSAKTRDAEKRGRFNLGEKLVLALCETATISSTTGGWHFSSRGRSRLRVTREKGSMFEAIIRLNAAERSEAIEALYSLLPPKAIATCVNGVQLASGTPVREFTAVLPTEVADDEGVMRRTRRQATIRLFEPSDGETPQLYEMGIPVVETDGRWHVDIGQKVPLNMERDNVSPAYLRDVRVAVLNAAAARKAGTSRSRAAPPLLDGPRRYPAVDKDPAGVLLRGSLTAWGPWAIWPCSNGSAAPVLRGTGSDRQGARAPQPPAHARRPEDG